MTNTINASEKPTLNGVNTPTLLATINAVGAQPELAAFQVPGAGALGVRRSQPDHRR